MKIEKIQKSEEAPRVVRFQIGYQPDDVVLQHTPFGVQISIARHSPSGELGGPSFPAKVVQVVLPPHSVADRIAVEAAKKQILIKGPVMVAPLQRPQAGAKTPKQQKNDDAAEQHYVADEKQTEKHQARYKDGCKHQSVKKMLERAPDATEPFAVPTIELPNGELYRAAIKSADANARIIRTEQVGPNSIAYIEIKPVQYNSKGDLELITDFNISVYCRPADVQKDDKGLATQALFRSGKQAAKIYQDLKDVVINPLELIDWGELIPYFFQYDYLIITDNYAWNAQTITRGASIGDQMAEYQRLADWKRRRGLKARVVSITDIVNGVFGNHRTGARDLQEVIRNFLKWALKTWNISFVLLGGDVNVLPVRYAPGAALGHIGVQAANNPPGNNQSFWTGAFLKMHVVNPGDWWPGSWDNQLVNAATGQLIPYDAAGASNAATPGWYYCTNNNYNTRSATRTEFVRVNGPAALVNATLQWLYEWNTIPTDFYYASLDAPTYNVPGRHDWDLLDNGIYGQHTGDVELDGVQYFADVSVGRAPTASLDQARAFVNKVVAYEQFRDPSGNSLDASWLSRMALVSSNWGGRWGIYNDANFPPANFRFNHPGGAGHSLIKLPDTDFTLDLNYNVLAVVSETDIRVLPYNDAAGRGWYYARSANDLSPSGISIDLLFFHYFFPIPTPWIVVKGTAAELSPQSYILDRGDADGSMLDQEELRRLVDADLPLVTAFTRLYEDDVDLSAADRAAAPVATLSTPALQSAINQGQHFLSLSGHGNSGGCCHFGHGVVNASTNGYHNFIAFADSCLTNQFDANDAVSEASVFHPTGGGVAYVGNSRFSWIGVGDNFQRAFFRRMATTRHLGHLNDTRIGMVDEATGFWRLYNKWVIYSQNLIGDPEMPVWTAAPHTILASIPAEWDVREPLPMHTSYRLLFFELPLAGVFVHLQQGAITRSASTDAAGNASLQLAGFHAGPAEITLSKIGYKPIIRNINILVPEWVNGTVAYIHHQEASATTSEIGLRIGEGEAAFVRPFVASKSEADYGIILDAATDAFVSEKAISLFVNANRNHGIIERFRFDA